MQPGEERKLRLANSAEATLSLQQIVSTGRESAHAFIRETQSNAYKVRALICSAVSDLTTLRSGFHQLSVHGSFPAQHGAAAISPRRIFSIQDEPVCAPSIAAVILTTAPPGRHAKLEVIKRMTFWVVLAEETLRLEVVAFFYQSARERFWPRNCGRLAQFLEHFDSIRSADLRQSFRNFEMRATQPASRAQSTAREEGYHWRCRSAAASSPGFWPPAGTSCGSEAARREPLLQPRL